MRDGPRARIGRVAATVALTMAVAWGSPVGAAPRAFAVRSVTVEHDGRWRPDRYGQQTREQCSRFRLSARTARRWFRRATQVDQHAWLEELDWTQCSATGTLRTSAGRTYRWELDESGRGQVVLSPTASIYLAGPELGFARR